MYNLDIPKFVRRLLPTFLRTKVQLAWIETLLKPFGDLLTSFNTFRSDKLRQLSYSGQTIQLERYLNDTFDATLRRIKIKHYSDTPDFDYLLSETGTLEDYDYLISEGEADNFIYLIGENSAPLDTDFVVLYPTDLSTPTSEIKSNVDKYRIAGKRYTIVLT